MRFRNVVIAVFCLALAVPAFASAQRADAEKVTGGGQVFASTDEAVRAGDTVGFVATDDGGRISGSLEVVRTSDASNANTKPTVILNANVTCLEVDGNHARFGGRARYADGTTGVYTADVTDNREEDDDTDVVAVRETDNPCEDDGRLLTDGTYLVRGNATVHNTQ